MNEGQAQWIRTIESAATQGSHIFPLMAACEAALESGFGQSHLVREANNLFGMKEHGHPEHGILSLPTKEFLDGKWTVVDANWMKYSSLPECFLDRMHTLGRLAPKYPHYRAALTAEDEYTYVREVSQSWSTDPQRSEKVIEIYDSYCEHWAQNAATTPDAQAPEAPAAEAPVMGVDESSQQS